MALDSRYFTSIDLEEYLVDKDTGAPLSGGTIEFWEDDNRTTPKLVYQLTGAPPNYTYSPLPNPVNIGLSGTPLDNDGNNVAIYYYPYDADGNLQLYYVVVKNSFGTEQFVREAWPNITDETNPSNDQNNISNELSNPQFVDINFPQNNPLTISFSGSSTLTVAIAPRWDLIISHTGAGSVVVTRNAVAGSSGYPNNPPYTLTVTAGANVSGLQLRQRLQNNPDIFSPPVGGENGYIATSILLAPSSSVTVYYQPNGLGLQTILSANNGTGVYTEFNNTVQLSGAANPSTGDTGYVDIIISLPVVGSTTLSNVQVTGLNSNIENIGYDQTTANRQKDQLFNYYNPLLQAKPIPSYLIGWDFSLNPAQRFGPTLAASAAGVNTSRYVWDQTIVYQSVNSGPAISRASSGALRVTATNATQFALIQYLPADVAKKILNGSLSANLAALTPMVGGLKGTISLWYTKSGSLPSTASNNSIVLTLDANGYPATFNGTWFEITRNGLGNAQFLVGDSTTTNFNDYGFSGWNLNGAADADLATFFAIVVGFGTLSIGETIDIDSISLVPGSIPTRPAPQSPSEVISDCCYYYRKSFEQATVPADAVGFNTGEFRWPAMIAGAAADGEQATSIPFGDGMISVPTITLYNPAPAGGTAGQAYNVLRSQNLTATSAVIVSSKSMTIIATGSAGTGQSDPLVVHWAANAQLGL